MPRATTDGRRRITREAAPNSFRLSHIFPLHKGEHRPLKEQAPIFHGLKAGQLDDAFLVYQGGKGSGKTICGAAADVYIHHLPQYKGLDSLIGRESYPSLVTSTGKEFFKIINRLPDRLIRRATEPTKSSMGFVDWDIGGTTFLCSLLNPDTWESGNFGFAWIDEGHRQRVKSCRDLISRLRQDCGPRTCLVTSNPKGRKAWFYNLGHPSSPNRMRRALWIEASSQDNPTLSAGYLETLEDLYGGKDSVQWKRWVEGKSSALEGAVLNNFNPDPLARVHVVPAFDLPEDAPRGRGLDWGIRNPCAVVWAAFWQGAWWVYDGHELNEAHPRTHADIILAKDGDSVMDWVPADPHIFENTLVRRDGFRYSIADEFQDAGVLLTRANNNRTYGLGMVMKMVAVDRNRLHPVTLSPGAPRLFIMQKPETEPLISELAGLEWPDENRPPTKNDGRDDFIKRDDHSYDALRYLIAENPDDESPEPVRRQFAPTGRTGYRGYGNYR